jgi:hypothetical protein
MRHGNLKSWLVSLGNANGYKAWTPDEKKNYEFSKIRNAKVDYVPDVVWLYKNQSYL